MVKMIQLNEQYQLILGFLMFDVFKNLLGCTRWFVLYSNVNAANLQHSFEETM